MHVLASALYAAVAWLALLAWLVISDGPVLLVLLASPIASGKPTDAAGGRSA